MAAISTLGRAVPGSGRNRLVAFLGVLAIAFGVTAAWLHGQAANGPARRPPRMRRSATTAGQAR